MEVNDLKNTWKSSFDKLNKQHLSAKEIEARLAIKDKSGSLISKIKRNLIYEIIASIVVIALVTVYLGPEIQTSKEWLVLGVLFLSVALLLLNAYHKYYKLKKIRVYDHQLNEAIQMMVEIAEKYIRFNTGKIMKYLILPGGLILGLMVGIIIGGEDFDLYSKLNSLEQLEIIFIIGWLLLIYGLSIPFSIWFNKKLYGRHVSELKQCLNELNQIEEENGTNAAEPGHKIEL